MFGVLGLLLGDIEDDELQRRQPKGQGAGAVLDEDADETLERAEDRPMQHYRRMAGVVLADVFRAEALRHREIDLHRTALPRATDRVLDVEFDLRAVEGAFAGQFFPFQA